MSEKVSAYNTKQDWLDPDGLLLIESWARDGLAVNQIADKIGIHRATLNAWMVKYPEVKAAISNGRELVDYKVENALLKSALGYKTKEVKVITTIRKGRIVEEVKEVTDKEFAPSIGAIQTWLYNRRPDKWKSTNSKSLLEDLEEDTNITITVERASASELKDGSNVNTNVSSTFEETETDWEHDVNKEITIRGLSEEEKKQRREVENKSQKNGKKSNSNINGNFETLEEENEDWLDNESDDWGNDVYEGG